jgi:hypothetical protein
MGSKNESLFNVKRTMVLRQWRNKTASVCRRTSTTGSRKRINYSRILCDAAYEAALKTYNEQREVQIVWDRADNKALGIIQLRMADKLQYLIEILPFKAGPTSKVNLMYQVPLQSLLISNLLSTSNLTTGRNLPFKLQS